MNQNPEILAKFDIDLAKAYISYDTEAKLRVLDAITYGKLLPGGVETKRPRRFGGQEALLLRRLRGPRRSGGSASCGGLRLSLTVSMVTLACPTLNSFDSAITAESGNNVLTNLFTLSTVGFNISTELRFTDNSKAIILHTTIVYERLAGTDKYQSIKISKRGLRISKHFQQLCRQSCPPALSAEGGRPGAQMTLNIVSRSLPSDQSLATRDRQIKLSGMSWQNESAG